MKDKEKRLWWCDRLRIGLLMLLGITGLLAYAGSMVCLVLMFVVLAAFCAVDFFMNRCPHCDRYLGRDWGLFCQHCGGRIREGKTDT